MHIYTIHEPPYWTADVDSRAEVTLIFVQEGFNWFAFFLAPVWALWHRLWLVFIGLVIASVLLTLLVGLAGLNFWFEGMLGLGFALFVGFEANDMRRWTLKYRAWNLRGVVAGCGRDEAVHRYFGAT